MSWERIDDQDWRDIAEVLPRPWPEAAARQDLRYWAGQERVGGRRRERRPGRPALAGRWGWTEKRVRLLLADVERWVDPHHGDPLADQGQPRASEGPVEGQSRASRGPAEGQPRARTDVDSAGTAKVEGPAEGQPRASEGPAEGQRGASRGPARGPTRVFSPITDTDTDTGTRSPDIAGQGAAAAGAPDVPSGRDEDRRQRWLEDLWTEVQALRAQHQPGAKGQALTTARRSNLASRCAELRQAGMTRADVLRAVAWVYTSELPSAEAARGTGDPVGVLLRPAHWMRYLELARDAEAQVPTARVDGGPPASTSGQGRPSRVQGALAALAERVGVEDDDTTSAEADGPTLRLVEG